ncbi:hypothetical protein U9M48_004227 [Paspalum notatum var. saurae]|uniref:Uncharacterized protein n=1 Tax=Paspalum notatum var. saurae TaxID=547442 RepID=A0AAQ3SEN5_PASNO
MHGGGGNELSGLIPAPPGLIHASPDQTCLRPHEARAAAAAIDGKGGSHESIPQLSSIANSVVSRCSRCVLLQGSEGLHIGGCCAGKEFSKSLKGSASRAKGQTPDAEMNVNENLVGSGGVSCHNSNNLE